MERQIRKRQGLFIKKDATLLKTISLKDFSFEEICDRELLFHDNPNGNLIYQKYHEPEAIQKAVRHHKGLLADMRDPDSITPILQPMDFTDDWKRQQDRASKRSKGRLDEEDEFELELELARRKEEDRAKLKAMQSQAKTPKDAAIPPLGSAKGDSTTEVPPPKAAADSDEKIIAEIRDQPEAVQNLERFKAQRDNLDAVGEVIKHLNDQDESDIPEIHGPMPLLADDTATTATTAPSVPFIPVPTENAENPERDAMNQYEAQQIQNEERYKQVYEAAKGEGFEAGFKEGEAKGALQLQELTKKVTTNMAELLSELSSLKRNILVSAEENFMQVCQALAESLIEREFALNPESFARVVKKAITDAMPDDKFKVKVHPAFLEHLKHTELGELEGRLVGDEHIEPGSFKIESALSSIEGDMKQIISDLLEAAQGDLFAQKTEEAG